MKEKCIDQVIEKRQLRRKKKGEIVSESKVYRSTEMKVSVEVKEKGGKRCDSLGNWMPFARR